MSLVAWSWFFMVGYIGAMLAFGAWGQRKVSGSDDFAVARGGYGPVALALAFAATTASGATFLGLPGFAYTYGVSALWVGFIYPLGVYGGVILCQRMVTRYGNRLGHRSIPEFLGDRFQSETIRVLAAILSLALIFFLAGQLIAGLAMFESLLGLSKPWALGLTALVLLVYVGLGGAHADILTDTVQAVLMLVIAVAITWMFVVGFGVAGGMEGVLARLEALDPATLSTFNPEFSLVNSAWAMVAMVIAYIPLGMLPHIGNKLWALKNSRDQQRFILTAFAVGLVFPTLTFGGLLSRAVLGDALFEEGTSPNSAIPALFIEVFPAWLAALLGAAILASIMSTADGLIISSSQVFANDIYRRTIVPRMTTPPSEADLDRHILVIGRLGIAVTMAAAVAIGWFTYGENIILVTWIGIGGMVSALAGSLVLGIFWRRTTAAGAVVGFLTGAIAFIVLHAGLLPESDAGWMQWLAAQRPNPYSCAAIAEILAVGFAVVVSLLTQPLPDSHLDEVFAEG